MLNPTDQSPRQIKMRGQVLKDRLNGGSPYFDMFACGYYGVLLEDCLAKCQRNAIPVRMKDVEAWEDGFFKHEMESFGHSSTPPRRQTTTEAGIPVEEAKLEDFPLLPQGWKGTRKRFFPCSADNKPLQKWGWTADFTPNLYLQKDAKALSPVGWVGQNMLYQPFIVIDIDGAGHGEEDALTIEFGRMFENYTMKMEATEKPGSFHLYFETNRLLPVQHYPHAKIDFMGNAVNAAVYLKNKVTNGVKMAPLTEEVWKLLQEYQRSRKEILCH